MVCHAAGAERDGHILSKSAAKIHLRLSLGSQHWMAREPLVDAALKSPKVQHGFGRANTGI